MSVLRVFATFVSVILFGVSVCDAQDFSTYRGFHLGADAAEIGQHIGSQRVDLRVIHQRPVVIEEFEWNVQRVLGVPSVAESLRAINFSFYDHQLFRMVVTYDPAKTEGLTSDDVIDAISAQYGKAAALDTLISVSSLGALYPDNQKTLALWDTEEYSYTLFRTAYSKTYGLIIVSKAREALAKTASEQSVLQDKMEAPQRALELQKQQDAERRDAESKARVINKPNFRP